MVSTRDRAIPSVDRQTPIDGTEPSDGCVIIDALVEPAVFAIVFDRHFTTIHRYLARRQLREPIGENGQEHDIPDDTGRYGDG